MKNILCLLFLLSIMISNAEETNHFSPKHYSFTDEDIVITPNVDYSSIFIVFKDDVTTESLSTFESRYNKLLHDNAGSFPWPEKKIFILDNSLINDG